MSLEEVEAGPSRLLDEGRDSLVVSHLNTRSLSSKLDELRVFDDITVSGSSYSTVTVTDSLVSLKGLV